MEIIRLLKIRYAQSLRWNSRNKKSSYFNVLKKRIKRFLISLSGNDLPSMILDILDIKDLACIHSRYINALKNISDPVNSKSIVKQKNQHYFIRSIRQAGLSLREARELGFQCGKHLWRTCLDPNKRHIGGRPYIFNEQLQNEIIDHMDSISNYAANRTIRKIHYSERSCFKIYKKKKIGETVISARNRHTTFKDAFNQFAEKPISIENRFKRK